MNTTAVLPQPAFPLLAELARRLEGRVTAPAEVRAAVALLTATADPERAEQLRPRPGEPAALVERLAVWALHRVDAGTARLAHELLLDAQPLEPAGVTAPTRALCPC